MDIERGTLKVTIEGSLMEVSDLRWSREARPIERHESGLGRKTPQQIAARFQPTSRLEVLEECDESDLSLFS
jgi:hypothetical protein